MRTRVEDGSMERRRFLKLGMLMGGTIVLGRVHRFGWALASAAATAIPTVDQLIMTNAVDNVYDIFAKGGKMGDVMVQRTSPPPMPLSEHGLSYHLASIRGDERKEILGEDTFCHRWAVTPDGQKNDLGQLKRTEFEAQGIKVVLAKEPTVVAGHAMTSGQIPRLIDFEKPPAAARLEAGPPGSDCEASWHFPPGTLQVEAKPGELVPDIF
jgi:hypothetical protein